MKKLTTKIDHLLLLCRNIEKTTALYCQTLGLKIYLQSQKLVQLKDVNNLKIFLKVSQNPSHLCKGYSPIISLKVQNFNEVYQKIIRNKLMCDGDIVELPNGKIITFVGFQGQMICINNLIQQQDNLQSQQMLKLDEDISAKEIKRILQQIQI